MDTLRELSRKRKSAEDLHSVVRTMKSLAAVSIRQFEEAARSLEDYYRAVELGLRAALLFRPLGGRVAEPWDSVLLLFGSDQGMAGQFNDLLVEYAARSLQERGPPLGSSRFWVAGAKAAGGVEERFGGAERLFSLPPSAQAIAHAVQEVVLQFERRRRERGEAGLVVFFNTPTSGASYRQERLDLLPPDRRWLERLGAGTWPAHCLPTYRAPWEDLFSALIGEYLFVALFRAFAASLAAENAARLASMERAEKNIREKREELTARHHSLRQQTSTEELFDVISGFEALTSGPGRG
ncbi:MAG: F0F1 ATP synthase subunit gamma [Thermodesulfobacteriota bacterium]